MEQAPVLRPLGIGDIIDRVIGLYRSRPLLSRGWTRMRRSDGSSRGSTCPADDGRAR